MSDIISGISSVLTMFGNVASWMVDEPLMLALIGIPIVGGIILLIASIFRR